MTKSMIFLPVAAVMFLGGTAEAVAPAFTVAVIPDTQNEQGRVAGMVQWIVNNQASQNIVFTTHEGDLTSSGGSQLVGVANAMYPLDPVMPWGTVPGNHDYYGIAQYDTYFGPAHFADKSWYGGSCQQSSWVTFQGGGRTFIGLEIQNDAPAEVLVWAQGVINTHYTTPVVLTTHDYMTDAAPGGRTGYGETLWNDLVTKNDQIFMVLAGHVHSNDGEFNQTSLNALNRPVFEMLADYQGRVNGGNGLMRLVTFDEDAGQVNVRTYSPTAGYETDADSQFTLTMDFVDRLTVPEPASLFVFLVALPFLATRRGRHQPSS